MRKLKGGNLDIDLASDENSIHWEQDRCPWNETENTKRHRCAVKGVSICDYFRGVEYPDKILCDFPES